MTSDVVTVAPRSAIARMLSISALRPRRIAGVHRPSTIVIGNVVGHDLGNGIPVAGREGCLEAFDYSGRCVFQPRRRPTEFIESRERRVEVLLIE